MIREPMLDRREMLAEQLNAIIDRYRDNPTKADETIRQLLGITISEDGVLYAEDVFEATRIAGLRIQFKELKDDSINAVVADTRDRS